MRRTGAWDLTPLSVKGRHHFHVFVRELPQFIKVPVLREFHVQGDVRRDIRREQLGEHQYLGFTSRSLTSGLLEQPQIGVPIS